WSSWAAVELAPVLFRYSWALGSDAEVKVAVTTPAAYRTTVRRADILQESQGIPCTCAHTHDVLHDDGPPCPRSAGHGGGGISFIAVGCAASSQTGVAPGDLALDVVAGTGAITSAFVV